MTRRIAALSVLITAACAGSFSFARAAEKRPCDLASGIAGLKAVQETGQAAGVLDELDARRRVLADTLRCASAESDETREKLSRAEPANGAMDQAKGELLARFDRARAYIDTQTGRLPDLGVYGTRELARGVRDWRQGTYLPLAAQAQNFALWQANQPIFDAASRRLDHIDQTLRSLGLVNQGVIREKFSSAREALQKAREANDRAAAGIRSSIGPDDVANLIQASLRSLAGAYENILGVSEEVKKIIPV